jgi:ATP-dependent Lon protease
VKQGLTILPVHHVDEVLGIALAGPLEPIEWSEADELAAQPPATPPQGDVVRH